MGQEIRDLEADADRLNLESYATRLRAMGYRCEIAIGYGSPKKAIPLLVNEKKVDLLVMGAHGHEAMFDLIFGTTISAVRHAVRVPVMVVR